MKSPIAIAIAALPAAALLLTASPARPEMWTDDQLTRETSPCALLRVSRQQATSRSCISCHDGTTGSGVSYVLPREPGAPRLSAMHGSHPIEVDYAVAQARRPRAMVPAAMLPESLVLPEGKVGCVTCHDGASSERHYTAISMSKSKLCSSCHDL
jgi:predicted CXXCH cytochrome family protein